MITKYMQLTSRADARQWASDFGLETEDQIQRVTAWIWEHAPAPKCTYAEHPLSALSTEEFWAIAAESDY